MIYRFRPQLFAQRAIGVALLVAGGMAASTGLVAAAPVQLSAMPDPVVLCLPKTTGTVTLSWDVTPLISDGANLKVDYGSGVYQPLHTVYAKGSSTEQVLYTGQPNLFALFDFQRDQPVATVRVDIQQQTCTGGSPPTLTLLPTKFLSTYHHSDAWSWCPGGAPFIGAPGIDVTSLGGKIAVGFEHYYFSLVCWVQSDKFYRGGVGFDMNVVNAFASKHGLKSAAIKFRQDTGGASCIDHIGINSDAWESLTPYSLDVLPDGVPTLYPMMASAKGGGFWGQADVLAPIALGVALGGASPHMHFVFVGPNEDTNAQDNDSCDSTISYLVLELVGQK